MRNSVKLRAFSLILAFAGCVALVVWIAQAREDNAAKTTALPATSAAAEEMAMAATNLLAALGEDQRKQASFELSSEERFNWHFIPRARKGLPIKEMAPAQRPLALALLSSGMGHRGYMTALNIMSLEQILLELEKGKGPKRDPEMYFFSIFGNPGPKETWGWRVEGHHLSLNFLIVDGKTIAGQPAFFGTNPAKILEGPRQGLRVLDKEEDMGREFVRSLNDEQRKKAIVDVKAPADIITGNSRKAQLVGPMGLGATDMSADQKQSLVKLVELYAHRLRTEMADEDLQKIEKAGWDKVSFAWAGGIEPGVGHYYRVKGPTFLIEYDDTQNNANHIHTVWRDLTNDFGDDLLKKHYEEHHQK